MNRARWMHPSVGILLLLGSVAAGQDATNKTIFLKRVFKKGDGARYESKGLTKASGGEATQTERRWHEIKDVGPNGDVVVAVTLEGGHYESPLGGGDIPAGVVVTETVDSRGRLLSVKRSAAADTFIAEAIRFTMRALNEPIFPEKAVKPGDSWATTMDNPAIKGKKIKFTTTYAGLDKVDGIEFWKLTQKSSAELADGNRLTGESTAWYEPTTGRLVNLETTLAGVASQFGTMSYSVVTTLSKSQEKPTRKGDK